jgi:hypothetical protein
MSYADTDDSTDTRDTTQPERGATLESYPWSDERDDVLHLDDTIDMLEDGKYYDVLKHHLVAGNTKIAQHVLIYNITSAGDCRHLGDEKCQVPAEACYANTSEQNFEHDNGGPLSFRRRQEVIWDHLTPSEFADTLLAIIDNKRNPVSTVRINQSGELRHQRDLEQLDHISRRLYENGFDCYVYTTSSDLDWSITSDDALAVNMSNQRFSEEATERFSYYTALPEGLEPEDVEFLDDDARHCPYDAHDGAIKCGDCRLCLDNNDTDVYIRPH